MAHEHWTGPWRVVVRTVYPELSYAVHLNGRSIARKRVSAVDIKPFHERPVELRHEFEDEFSHFVWGPDIGPAEVSNVAAPLYTLIDRKASWIGEDTWVWEYKGRHRDGAESSWRREEDAQESFTPLQLDVFHALWLYGSSIMEQITGLDHQECQQKGNEKRLPEKRRLRHARKERGSGGTLPMFVAEARYSWERCTTSKAHTGE